MIKVTVRKGGDRMEIRRVRQEDIQKIVEMVKQNYDEVMSKVHSEEVIRKFEEHNNIADWQRQMRWKEIFIVEDSEDIIATGALANFGDVNSPKYSISNFFVKVENQNKGVGKFLLNHILQVTKKKKISTLHVPSSRSGLDFYEKMGFAKDDIQNDELDEITWMTLKI